MPVPTPPPAVTLNLGFSPDDGAGAGVRLVFQSLLSALSARDAYAAAQAQQIGDLQTQLAGIATLTPVRKVATGTGLTGGGDLSTDRTIAIAANGVSNDLLAKMPTLTLKANLLGSTAAVQDASLPALLDAVFGATQGGLLYRNSSGWAPLALGANGTMLQSNGLDLVFGPATAGTLQAANNLSDLPSPPQARTNLGAAGLGDLRALAVQIAKLKGSAAGLFGGLADDFKDQAGYDTANSLNAAFDPVNNAITNAAVEIAETLLAMTSNAAPSGYTASGSTAQSASFDYYMAFDDSTASYWQSQAVAFPQQITRQMPAAIRCGAYAIRSASNLSYPTSHQFQGSNDGSAWTTLDTQTGLVFGTSERKVFPVPYTAQGSYKYYRVNVLACSNITQVMIAEIEFLQAATAALDLRSAAFTAQAVPSRASIFALVKATAGTITPGTNLTASISRDGGTTYTAFALAQTGTIGGYAIYEANGLDISGQPSGSSMRWRMQTTGTALGIAVDAVVAQWG